MMVRIWVGVKKFGVSEKKWDCWIRRSDRWPNLRMLGSEIGSRMKLRLR